MKNNWVSYQNGNYKVTINLDNGTKIRANDLDFFAPATAESIDVKITGQCDMGCAFCHEDSRPDGKHGDIMSPSFLDKIHPYMELAIGGGNPLSHPDLLPFLRKCRELKAIPSMTVNQVHFEKSYDFIRQLVNEQLIYGLGISLVNPNSEGFIEKVKSIKNAVIHVIAGILTEDHLQSLSFNDLRILILGYKEVRRGKKLYEEPSRHDDIEYNKKMLKERLPELIKKKAFRTISFDNLSLDQLCVREILTPEQWDKFYMGDDGIDGQYTSATFFVDMVNREFAINSCSMERWPLKDTLEDMFNFLKDRYNNNKREV